MKGLRADFRNTFVTARSYRSTEDEIGQDLQRAENYLSLVGLVVVVLGGIGVSSVTRVFIDQKLKSIAVLKCVGARHLAGRVRLPAAGDGARARRQPHGARPWPTRAGRGAVGAGDGWCRRCPSSHALTPGAMLQAVGIGLMVSLLFSLVPLLRVRHIKPSLLLRQQESAEPAAATGCASRRRRSSARRWSRSPAGRPARGAWARPSAAGSPCSPSCCTWRAGAGACDDAARPRAVVCRAARRAASEPSGQPDAGRAAGRRPRRFLHHRHPRRAGEPAPRLRDRGRQRNPRPVPDRHPGDQVQGLERSSRERTGRTPPPRHPGAARAHHAGARPRGHAREPRGRARARRAGPGVHRDVPAGARSERAHRRRTVLGSDAVGPSRRSRSKKACGERFKINIGDDVRFDVLGQPIVARVTSVRAGELARQPRRRLHVRVPARRARAGAARVHLARARARRPRGARADAARPRRAVSRTSRSSTSAKCSTRCAASSPT